MKLLLSLFLCVSAFGAPTRVLDVMRGATGAPEDATCVISWPTFVAAGGATVGSSQFTLTVIDGVVDISLQPTQGSTPTVVYSVKCEVVGLSSTVNQYWNVPVSTPPVTLSQIIVPGPGTAQTFTQAAVAGLWSGSGCTTGTNALLVNGNCGVSGGGVVSAAQLADLAATNTSSTVQTIGAGCNTTTPCQLRIGTAVFSMTAPVTATLSGASFGGTVFWYLSSAQILTAGHNSATTVTCSAGCNVVTGIIAFPPDSVPLWATTFTGNAWDTINIASMDFRAVYSRDVIAPGSGISSANNPSTGVQTISTDPNQVPRYFGGSGAPSMNCTAARDWYTSSSPVHLYWCSATNTWTQVDGGGSSTSTITHYFPISYYINGALQYNILTAEVTGQHWTVTGPNSISLSQAGLYINVNDWFQANDGFSTTWNGTSTVDLGFDAANFGGTPSAGNWNFNFYLGCAAANSTWTYGTASATTPAVPPSTANGPQTRYTATNVNIPASCGPNIPIQIIVQRTADTGGSTGVTPLGIGIQITIRGN